MHLHGPKMDTLLAPVGSSVDSSFCVCVYCSMLRLSEPGGACNGMKKAQKGCLRPLAQYCSCPSLSLCLGLEARLSLRLLSFSSSWSSSSANRLFLLYPHHTSDPFAHPVLSVNSYHQSHRIHGIRFVSACRLPLLQAVIPTPSLPRHNTPVLQIFQSIHHILWPA